MDRFLFVGVGGSGGKTLRFLFREIERRLEAESLRRGSLWTQGMPAIYQFVHFDLPETFDGYVDPSVPRVLSLDSAMYTNLADHPLAYERYDDDLVGTTERRAAVQGWRPSGQIPPPFGGAGQRRSVGRAVTVCSLSRVDDALRRAAAGLQSLEADQHQSELSTLFGEEVMSRKDGSAFVIGSLGGGSGSGMFIDVVDMVRAQRSSLPWIDDPALVLFTSDVFESLPESARTGTEPNSLAAVSEYLSAFLWEGPMNIHENALHLTASPVPAGGGRRVGRNAFFIGAGNSNIHLDSPEAVYGAVGRALAAQATTSAIQQVVKSVIMNTRGLDSSIALTSIPDATSEDQQAARSFGFGSAGLARQLFATYASERLVRLALDNLLTGHRDLGTGKADHRPEEVLVAEVADRLESRFFEASGLWELGDNRNQVLDALRSFEQEATALRALKERAVNEMAERKAGLAPLEGLKAFNTIFENLESAYETDRRARRDERARTWARNVQDRLCEATVEVIATRGLPVAAVLLERLRTEVDDSANQLELEIRKLTRGQPTLVDSIQETFKYLKGRIVGTNQVYTDAAESRRIALSRNAEASLRSDAAVLLRDVRDNLVPQVAECVSEFQRRLVDETSDMREMGGVIAKWPRRDVPEHLMPSDNEIPIEPIAGFADTLERLLEETFQAGAVQQNLAGAVREIVRGGWPTAAEPAEQAQTLISIDGRWVPTAQFAQPLTEAGLPENPRPGASRIPYTTDGLLTRSRRWMNTRSGAVVSHVTETLSDYLADRAEGPKRLTAFLKALETAMGCSQPLVMIDATVKGKVHGSSGEESGDLLTVMTPIPISDSEARKKCEAVLRRHGIEEARLATCFGTSPTSEIEIMSFMGYSVHPVVMSSLIQPIGRAWAQAIANPNSRSQFWQYRRARTLEAFTPLAPSTQAKVLRGWYIGLMLGLVRSANGQESPEVFDGTRWLRLPAKLLVRPQSNAGMLPALFESAGLALVDLGSGNDESANAYGVLVRLGSDPYEELGRWIHAGKVDAPEGFTDPPESPEHLTEGLATGQDEGIADTRRKAALSQISDVHDVYLKLQGQSLAEGREIDPRWELSDLGTAALGSLLRALSDTYRWGTPTTPGHGGSGWLSES